MCACYSFNYTHGPSTVHFLWGQLLPNVRTIVFASDCICGQHTPIPEWACWGRVTPDLRQI